MPFFSQKVLRTRPGKWTFVIITDRNDLDDQAYKEFANTGILTEGHILATSGEHLKRLLSEDHRYIFTIIPKLHTERFGTYPILWQLCQHI